MECWAEVVSSGPWGWPLRVALGDGPASALGKPGCQEPGTCQFSPLPAAPWDQQLPSWSQGAISSEQLGRAGQGGEEGVILGRKSFGWSHARALGVTDPVPKAQAAASLVSLSLIPHCAHSPDNLPGMPVTLSAPRSNPIRWLPLCLFYG